MNNKLECTLYIEYEFEDPNWYPCQCPICKGFLKWENDKPKCNKCGAELLAIPDIDEETNEILTSGKICPLSKGRFRKK